MQKTNEPILSEYDTCPGCGASSPAGAAFCASCGERLDRAKSLAGLLQGEEDISARYRILSLIRRRPFINLYLALDLSPSARGRIVAMRDVDMSSLDEQARVRVLEQAQQEYDLLRRWQPPTVLRAIDLRYTQGHLYTVAGFAPHISTGEPAKTGENEAREDGEAKEQWPRLTTLQDFLQSGQGLPSEQRTLQIMSHLCAAVDALHSHQIIPGDLDPSTVILNGTTVDDSPGLMISWVPPGARAVLLPEAATSLFSYFVAPEALQDEGDARSDIYSLGAIFYLLLTGMPPEESTLRHRSRLRTPHEINPRMSLHISECVMGALAVDPNERFQTVADFTAALRDPRYRRPASQSENSGELSPEVETVRILPLSYKDLARWRSGRGKKQISTPLPVIPPAGPVDPSLPPEEFAPADTSQKQFSAPEPVAESAEDIATLRLKPGNLPRFYAPPETPANVPVTPAGKAGELPANAQPTDWTWKAPQTPAPRTESQPLDLPIKSSRSWKQLVTRILSIINPRNLVGTRLIAFATRAFAPRPAPAPRTTSSSRTAPATQSAGEEAAASALTPGSKKSLDINSWIEQVKQAVLGQQQHVIAAAAIIETPLRVLPDQLYTIRMHIMGRDQIETPAEKQQSSGGLSALVHGDVALIEVRSVLQESYSYVVQTASVTIPAEGYVAEVSIPMQPLSSTPTGRRDRLHVFFLNEHRHPLYEKPFVLEIFVSHHVKRGSEGHHVLTIPV